MSHVHLVVHADVDPETIMHDCKSYASRFLRPRESIRTRWWTRHGSTRYLWRREDVEGAVRYVVDGQGEAMEVFLNTAP
jgi:REP element-mobilizing transposase RayT